ncbi:hypothetical protein AVEN_189291-1 [Araneus ventricosus]|uniref:Uncharacterized protein n=1 Tax=Araneus ventricosus TaxID=182803 RepID=A0A4Y2AU70_ARAVE|nr:hypothetical protein AVEN_112061-1 [Araneus ventricosus]GBL83263.1 hypothetical protein AVEN_189291-1 [Araneus ventricosus]
MYERVHAILMCFREESIPFEEITLSCAPSVQHFNKNRLTSTFSSAPSVQHFNKNRLTRTFSTAPSVQHFNKNRLAKTSCSLNCTRFGKKRKFHDTMVVL